MIFVRRLLWSASLMALCITATAQAEVSNTLPPFKEVYDLIRDHLAGETEAELEQAAVQGLLGELHSKVSLVGKPANTNEMSEAPVLISSRTFDSGVGYMRLGKVGEGLATAISGTYKAMNETNRLKGLVIDLRFAGGMDYAEAAAAADLFLDKDAVLLDWGKGFVHSKTKSDSIGVPVAILVNQKTAAAAEAFAAILRQTDRALILGSRTAGEATMDQIFPLKNGQSLRIATAAIKMGDGEALSANGLAPDIQVAVSPEDEKAYLADPYKDMPRPALLIAGYGSPAARAAGTNRVAMPRPTEADLIRERKQNPGREVEYTVQPDREVLPEKPVVRDPVLARALDLIKGISVLRSTRPA